MGQRLAAPAPVRARSAPHDRAARRRHGAGGGAASGMSPSLPARPAAAPGQRAAVGAAAASADAKPADEQRAAPRAARPAAQPRRDAAQPDARRDAEGLSLPMAPPPLLLPRQPSTRSTYHSTRRSNAFGRVPTRSTPTAAAANRSAKQQGAPSRSACTQQGALFSPIHSLHRGMLWPVVCAVSHTCVECSCRAPCVECSSRCMRNHVRNAGLGLLLATCSPLLI